MRKAIGVTLAALLMLPASAAAEVLTSSEATSVAVHKAEVMGKVEGQPTVAATNLTVAESSVMGVESMPSGQVAPGASSTEPASIVTLHGHFTASGVPTPKGTSQPTGTLLELAIDSSGKVVAEHLAEPTNATVPSGHAARARAIRQRARAHASVTSTWPCKDEVENGHTGAEHCYDEARWAMTKSSEKVQGSEADIETTEMFVPEPGQDAFVTNEEWVGFPERENSFGQWWLEAGQIAGNNPPDPNRQMYWFWAYNNASGFHYGNPGWPEEGWIFHAYSMQSQLNGTWCVYIDGGSAGCVGGLLAYSKELTVGIEAATPWQPANKIYDQTNYTATNGEVRPWNKASWERDPTMCMEGFSRESPPHYYAGNIHGWVPC